MLNCCSGKLCCVFVRVLSIEVDFIIKKDTPHTTRSTLRQTKDIRINGVLQDMSVYDMVFVPPGQAEA